MKLRRSAFVDGCVPIALGFGGMAKLGHFHLGVFIVSAVFAAFAYHNGHHAAKYGTLSRKSLLFGEIPGRPPER